MVPLSLSGSRFGFHQLLPVILNRHKKSHQLVGPDNNNEDSGPAVEKLLSSINQTDTFTQSQSIYFIRFQVFATWKNEKLATEILR